MIRNFYKPTPKPRYTVDQVSVLDYFTGMLNGYICLPLEQREPVWSTKNRLVVLKDMYNGQPFGQLLLWDYGSTDKYKLSNMRNFITDEIPTLENRPTHLNFDGGQKSDLICGMFGEKARGVVQKPIRFDVRTEEFNEGKIIAKKDSNFIIEDLSCYLLMDAGQFTIEVERFVTTIFPYNKSIIEIENFNMESLIERLWKLYWIRNSRLERVTLDNSWTREEVKEKFITINDNIVKASTVTKSRTAAVSCDSRLDVAIKDYVSDMSDKNYLIKPTYYDIFAVLQRCLAFSRDGKNHYKVTNKAAASYLNELSNYREGIYSNACEKLLTLKNFDDVDSGLRVMGCVNNNKVLPNAKLFEGLMSLFFLGHTNGIKFDPLTTKTISRLAYATLLSGGGSTGGEVDVFYKLWGKLLKASAGTLSKTVFVQIINEESNLLFNQGSLKHAIKNSDMGSRYYKAYLLALSNSASDLFLDRIKLRDWLDNNQKSKVDNDHLFPKYVLINKGIKNHSSMANITPMAAGLNRSKKKDLPEIYYPRYINNRETFPDLEKEDVSLHTFNTGEENNMLTTHCLWPGWHKIKLDKDSFDAYLNKRTEMMSEFLTQTFKDF